MDEQISESLNDACFAVQCAVRGVARDAEGNFGNYASLSAVWDALRPHFEEHCLLVSIVPGKIEMVADKVFVVPIHASITWTPTGERETFEFSMPVSKLDPQAFGSALTYGQRYLLMSRFGLPPSDDDGQAASGMRPEEMENYQSALEACETLEELRAIFAEAYRAAGSDAAALKVIGSAKDTRKRALECRAAVDRHTDLLLSIRDALAAGAWEEARSAYEEIPQDDQMRLSLAPSRGGFFTTEEVKQMKSNAWHAARREVGK